MLQLAEQTLGPLASRVRLHEGKIDAAPKGPFDAATCISTMHFEDVEVRRQMLASIRRRLKPQAPFIVVHLSFPQSEGARERWLSRYAAYMVRPAVDAEKASQFRKAVEAYLTILDPQHDEALLQEAGFTNVELFYAGFAFRGWVCYA